ncbi:MAG: phosphoglycerate kinase, partial [Patescibacteria group bacterium]
MIKLPGLPKNLKEKRILMRVDFNTPCRMGKVEDDFRIQKTLPTISDALKRGNNVILISHLEERDKTPTFLSVAAYLRGHGLKYLRFVEDIAGDQARRAAVRMGNSDVLLLENLRKDPREKDNDSDFARQLAGLADVFVNEAFSASHREHASIVGVPKFLPSFAGPLFLEETKRLSKAFRPSHPFLFVLGGMKPIKLLLLEKFLPKADAVIVGGTMANTLLAAKGLAVGKSQIEKESIPDIKKSVLESVKILFPLDVGVENKGRKGTKKFSEIDAEDNIFDLGPETMRQAESLIKNARFVLWNGPLGYVEKGFDLSTRQLARSLIKSKAETIVGGGDTVAFLRKEKILNKFSFVSTGGGAMLEFLANGTLPGIEALK